VGFGLWVPGSAAVVASRLALLADATDTSMKARNLNRNLKTFP
jgi:hypothetical protein